MSRLDTTLSGKLGIIFLPLMVACGPTEIDLGNLTLPITDGQLYSGHPSVGLLVLQTSDGQQGICTGSVIGQKTVLTAAHCVEGITAALFVLNGQISGGQLYGDQYNATAAAGHQGYNGNNSTTAPVNDVAVIQLETAPPVTPIPVATSAPTVGLPVTLVGYGKTSDNATDDGVKRKATNAVAQVTGMEITFNGTGGGVGNICNGDSGGPTFATINGQEVQIGVHSYGLGPQGAICGNDGHDMRADVFTSWIQQTTGGDVTLQGSSGTTPQSAGTVPFAGTCTANTDCVSGMCVQVSATSGQCTQQCQSAADCPSGASCVQTDQPGLLVCDPTGSAPTNPGPNPGPTNPPAPPNTTNPPPPSSQNPGGPAFGSAAATDGGCSMISGTDVEGTPLGLLALLLLVAIVHTARRTA